MSVEAPTHNSDAEKSVLGAIMLNPDMLDEVTPIISADNFYSTPCRLVFDACRSLREAGKYIDAVTVAERLEKNRDLEEVGGPDFLEELLESVPHAWHAPYYAGIVRDRWVRREVRYACTEAANGVVDLTSDAQEIVAGVQGRLAKLDETLTATDGSSKLSDLLMDLQTELETGVEPGVKIGYAGVDSKTNGLQPGSLTIIGARPSVGKTALGTCMAMHAAENKHHVLFFSVEMTAMQVSERMVSADSRISMNDIRGGMLSDSDRFAVTSACNRLAELPVWIEDSSAWTVPQMAACARIHSRKNGVDLIVVDYLQLIKPERAPSREQQVATQSRQLKHMAKESGCPIIVMAQLNRDVEKRDKKRPRMSDLRESGAIEQDADIIMLLNRPSDKDTNEPKEKATLHLEKNRNGPTGDIDLTWRAETMQFIDEPYISDGFFSEPADVWGDKNHEGRQYPT